MNNHLRKKGFSPLEDVETGFEDGITLMHVVNALYDVPIPKYNKAPKMRPHKLDNLSLAFAMVEQAQIKTNFLKREHLLDHDLKMILGMMWAIILDYAIKGISVDEMTAKEGLLLWCRKKTAGYRDVDPPGVQNFSTSWRDGMALCALIHRHRPDLIDYDSLDKKNAATNLELAFNVAEKSLDIPRLLEVEDLVAERPDERSVMTYISEFFHRFASQDIRENAARRVNRFLRFMRNIERQEEDYTQRARALIAWANQQAADFSNNSFGDTLDDAVAVFGAYKEYLTSQKPAKAAEKLDVETLFAEVQTALLVNNRRKFVAPDDATPEAVDAAFDALGAAERARGQAVRENRFRFIKREETKLSQEKVDEIQASFRHFDKNDNKVLDKVEFKAALSALGVPFKDDAALQKVFEEVSGGTNSVTFDQYLAFNVKLMEDKDTPEQLLQSFQLLSESADTIADTQLASSRLSPEDVEYLKSKMPQTEDGRYNYNAYVHSQFA